MDTSEITMESLYDWPRGCEDIFEKAHDFYGKYEAIREAGEYSYRRQLVSAAGNRVRIWDHDLDQEREMIMFASNSYLGLSTDPRVVEASLAATKKYGYGTGSVGLMSGTTALHRELEKRIAAFYGCEAACVFPTGYQANVGTIQSMLTEEDVALADMYSHASIIDGVIMSAGTLKYFQHNDMESLDSLLKRLSRKFKGKLVVTDGVFSMDGDICPLDRIMEIARERGARVLIDEAHALGIIGPGGRGTAELYGLTGKIDLTIGTLSKAPSAIGGYLTGTREAVEFVRHFGRSYVFSTTIPAPVAAGLIEVFKILEADPEPRKKLDENRRYLVEGLHRLGFDTLDSMTAIIPVLVPDEIKLRQICKELHRRGIFVTPVTFPAVAKGRSRIRVSVMSTHTKEDLDSLLGHLEELN